MFRTQSFAIRRNISLFRTYSQTVVVESSSKPKMRAMNILAMKHTGVLALPQNITVSDAISNMAVHNQTSALIINDFNEVEGIFTSRDLLRYLHYGRGKGRKSSASIAEAVTLGGGSKLSQMKKILELPIKSLVTTKEKMVYCSLTDTARRIREVMFQLKIRNIPVLDDGAVVGIINIKDLTDSSFSLEDTGGKKGYMNNIIGRMGLPSHTTVRSLTSADNEIVIIDSSVDANIDRLDPISMILDGEELSAETYRNMYTRAKINSSKLKLPRYKVEMASSALPHPYKDAHRGVTENRKALGMDRELCDDNSLNADAHFAIVVPVRDASNTGSQVYACVADGVGSWAQFGVDPREFAHQLVRNVKLAIVNNAYGTGEDTIPAGADGNLYEKAKSMISSYLSKGGDAKKIEENRNEIVDTVLVNVITGEVNSDIDVPTLTNEERAEVTQPMVVSCSDVDAIAARSAEMTMRGNDSIHPLDAILDSWNSTLSNHVVGSSTICVATIDTTLNQLSYSNLGDGGLMVVRHTGSGTAGFVKDMSNDDSDRTSKFSLAYLSQQQLRSFNLPYQLGYSGSVEYGGSFENPIDADTASIPILPGDVVIMATDGIFDNIDLNEIVNEVQAWEDEWFAADNNICLPHPQDTEPVKALAKRLVLKARDASIDTRRDSPFALLAKENDILWSGGMPDDTTVVVMRIVS